MVKVFGCSLSGLDGLQVTVEVNVSRGAKFYMVGLPDNAIKESHQRISAAVKNIGMKIPIKEIIVNLAPADIRKEGSAYDLTIAIGILTATGLIPKNNIISDYLIMGELSLDGFLRPVKGVLSMAVLAKRNGFKGIIAPAENSSEASLVDGIHVLPVNHLTDLISHILGKQKINPLKGKPCFNLTNSLLDFKDVKGQKSVKRALEIFPSEQVNRLQNHRRRCLANFLLVSLVLLRLLGLKFHLLHKLESQKNLFFDFLWDPNSTSLLTLFYRTKANYNNPETGKLQACLASRSRRLREHQTQFL